jgi:hypothetical protein
MVEIAAPNASFASFADPRRLFEKLSSNLPWLGFLLLQLVEDMMRFIPCSECSNIY